MTKNYKYKSHDQKERYLKIAGEQLALSRERVEVDKQRLALARETMELNVSRKALQHIIKLQEIEGNPTLDDEDKVRAARKELFGSAP